MYYNPGNLSKMSLTRSDLSKLFETTFIISQQHPILAFKKINQMKALL